VADAKLVESQMPEVRLEVELDVAGVRASGVRA